MSEETSKRLLRPGTRNSWRFLASLTLALSLSTALINVPAAQAWEYLPEFQSLSEEEQAGFDDARLMGPEYQSDILAFDKPVEWEHLWLTHPYAFDTTVGSISAVNFLISHRLKLHQPLTPWLEARLTYFDEQNHDRHATHLIPELVLWPLPWLGVSAYGEPTYEKRQTDDGVALLVRPSKNHEIRLFNTWVDVTRQKRSDRNDKFAEDELPFARGLVGRFWVTEPGSFWAPGDFLEYTVRWETRTRWQFPDEKYDYGYWKALVSVFANKRLTSTVTGALRVQADRRFESREPWDATSPVDNDATTTDRLMATAQATFERFGPGGRWEITPGFQYAHRQWLTRKDHLIYDDYLPFVWLRIPTRGDRPDQNYWRIGYDTTFHQKVGGPILALPVDKDGAINQRLNVSYGFGFGKRAEFVLLASFDVDSFGGRDTWEGGNALLRLSLP